MKISAILLAGGSGTRINSSKEKQFIEINKKPILYYSLKLLINQKNIDEIIIVYKKDTKDKIEKIVKKFFKNKTFKYTEGGNTRQQSVFNGLKIANYDSIILHETARPFVTKEELEKIVLNENKNVTLSLSIPFTVGQKNSNNYFEKTLNRESLFNVLLPQKFDRIEFLKAHEKALIENKEFTDDSSLLFNYNYPVAIIEGAITNIKVTTPLDLIYAKEIFKQLKGKI